MIKRPFCIYPHPEPVKLKNGRCLVCLKSIRAYAKDKKLDKELKNIEKEVQIKLDIRQQPHYAKYKIQPVIFITENDLDFLTGNIIKYVMRHKDKNGVQDLEKAKHYLDMLIQKTSGQPVKP